MYYTNNGDCCRCFHCEGGLRNWLKTDNVFVEHAKCFPKCNFIHSVVGTDFVNATQGIRMNKLHGGNMNRTITLEEVLDKLKVMDLTKMKNIQTASRRRSQILNSGDKKQEEEEEEHSKDCYDNPVRFVDCKVCFTRRATVAFFPCGHLACCEDCGRIKNCPICRGEVMQSVNDVSIPLTTKDVKSTTNGMCVMCMMRPCNVLQLPCKHIALCDTCHKLHYPDGRYEVCWFCTEEVEASVPLYIP